MQNSKRVLIQSLHRIADRRGLSMVSFSRDWIVRLERNGVASHIVGYDFPLNNATARLLAKDKAAAADVLEHVGVPRVEHRLFHHPDMIFYVGDDGNWPVMMDYAAQHDFNVVIKPNEGTGGHGVCLVDSARALERCVTRLFATERSLCLSPFISVLRECRLIVLDDEVLVAYEKIRPSVVGDGKHTVMELVAAAAGEWTPEARRFLLDRRDVADVSDHMASLPSPRSVPGKGEPVLLNWRHNLGQGAVAKSIDPEPLGLADLARRAMRALGLRFASVDVIETPGKEAGTTWRVLEMNSGIMMESYARQTEHGLDQAFRVYDRAVSLMFP